MSACNLTEMSEDFVLVDEREETYHDIGLKHDRYLMPDGSKQEFSYLIPSNKVMAVIYALTENGIDFYCDYSFRRDLREKALQFPKGDVSVGESNFAALLRLLKENGIENDSVGRVMSLLSGRVDPSGLTAQTITIYEVALKQPQQHSNFSVYSGIDIARVMNEEKSSFVEKLAWSIVAPQLEALEKRADNGNQPSV